MARFMLSDPLAMASLAKIVVGDVVIDVVDENLLDQPVEAIMISANNLLRGKSGRAKDVKKAAGPIYEAECSELADAFRPAGVPQGTAVVTGGYNLAQGNVRRRVIQAITIAYHSSVQTKASPEILYRATRAGLEKAELYRVTSVATYLMTARAGYATHPEAVMAETLCRTLIDHARIARSVNHIVIAERNDSSTIDRVRLACDALSGAYSKRNS
jgi:O-acetyl-ADP-ribose deacetylase (regulator of RNase III)